MTRDVGLDENGSEQADSRPWVWIGGLSLLLGTCLCLGLSCALFLAYRVWTGSQADAQADGRPGIEIPLQFPGHVDPGEPHQPYNSDPPTSGPHHSQSAKAGFYTEPLPDELLVHNLEHGYVIIWYNCGNLASAECERLQRDIQAVTQKAGNSPRTGTPKLIAVPRPSMDSRLALTSWGRLDKFEAFNEERILNFILAFRDEAPEPNVP